MVYPVDVVVDYQSIRDTKGVQSVTIGSGPDVHAFQVLLMPGWRFDVGTFKGRFWGSFHT